MARNKANWTAFGVLSLSHLINDMYFNFLPQLLPTLLLVRGYSLTAGANLVAIFSISSSLMQPLFGYLVDMKNLRWLASLGTLWMALLLSTTGFVGSYPILLLIAGISGLGTAAFHPQASAMVGEIGGKRTGFLLAAFIAAGNIGLAVSPLLFLPLFQNYGLKMTWVAVLPGTLSAILLHRMKQEKAKSSGPGLAQVFDSLKESSAELLKLMLVVAIRSLVHTGLMTLLPLYFLSLSFSAQATGSLIFITLTIGAIGGVLGGYISDRYGKKLLIVGSLFLASLFFYVFLNFSGIPSFVFLGLGGMALLSSFSVTVAAAQEIVPENKALASGLSLGFAIGMGGLAVSPLGKFAEVYGIEAAVHLILLLPAAAAIIGLTLKKEVKAGSF